MCLNKLISVTKTQKKLALLDRFEERFSVGDFVRDSGKNPFEVGRLSVQFLEGIFGTCNAIIST